MERPARPAADNIDAGAATIWALSDGRAGNARQADALAQALQAGPVRSHTLAPRWPWRLAAPLRMPGSQHAFGPGFAAGLRAPPRVAIGCGRQAALATRLLRAHDARVVQVLDPRLDPRHWDIVVAPYHDHLHGANVLSTLGSLHPVDDVWLAQGRAAHPQLGALPQPRTTVLIGAPSRHAPLDMATLERFATQLLDGLADHGGSVLMTASRRTPTAWRTALRHRFAHATGVIWLGPEDGANPYPGLLGWADRIVCTPDSVNMISEACATPVPVHVVEPDRTQGRLREFLHVLLGQERIRKFEPALPSFDVSPLRETARVAREVRSRLEL
ncbi:MAG TPA: mitochondrial fission ELM1 family protein [Luteimonas sp.]|nr:mitochondrial fission ELM1 family protein [Luteimonas sp.]